MIELFLIECNLAQLKLCQAQLIGIITVGMQECHWQLTNEVDVKDNHLNG